MTITFTSLAIIAGLSTTISAPITETSIQPTQTQVLSKDELVQIINNEQLVQVHVNDLAMNIPSFTIENTVLMAKSFVAKNKNTIISITEKAFSDDE